MAVLAFEQKETLDVADTRISYGRGADSILFDFYSKFLFLSRRNSKIVYADTYGDALLLGYQPCRRVWTVPTIEDNKEIEVMKCS